MPRNKKTTPPQAPAAEATAAPIPPTLKGKVGLLVTLLRGSDGMTIAAACQATGWQAHSVRGALAGSVKKKLGLPLTSTIEDGVRVYRIVEVAP